MSGSNPFGPLPSSPRQRKVTPIWHALCQTTKAGTLIPNLYNALVALRSDPAFAGKFRYDEMLRAIVCPDQTLEDHHVIKVQEWMQANGLQRIGAEAVRGAIEIVARENIFHPVRDYLDQLSWDGQDRLSTWLSRYLGAANDTYHSSIGVWFMLSMVARIYQPGCKADYMLVLEGPQGTLKSQAVQALAGKYYSDTLPDLTSDAVRLSQHLAGKWLIEVSEMSSFNRTAASHLKSFLTSQVEQYTRKFGRNEVREARQCVFVGTTNKEAYLRDETGGRRFWPVKTGTIDLDALRTDRDQLLAQAVAEFKDGNQWWPDDSFAQTYIQPVQEARYEADGLEQAIADWDRCVPVCDSNGRPLYDAGGHDSLGNELPPVPRRSPQLTPPYSLLDIARGALHFATERFSKRDALRLTDILVSLGWQRAPRTNAAKSLWIPP